MILAEKITEARWMVTGRDGGETFRLAAGGIQMGECTVHAGFAESAPSC